MAWYHVAREFLDRSFRGAALAQPDHYPPVWFEFSIENVSRIPRIIVGAYLDVEVSQVDRDPLVIVDATEYGFPAEFVASIANYGWSPAVATTISYFFVGANGFRSNQTHLVEVGDLHQRSTISFVKASERRA